MSAPSPEDVTVPISPSWVVYQMTIFNKRTPQHAVCSRDEWDEMERKRPGHHTLIRDSFAHEGAAEAYVRKCQPPPEPARKRPKPVAGLPDHVTSLSAIRG